MWNENVVILGTQGLLPLSQASFQTGLTPLIGESDTCPSMVWIPTLHRTQWPGPPSFYLFSEDTQSTKCCQPLLGPAAIPCRITVSFRNSFRGKKREKLELKVVVS